MSAPRCSRSGRKPHQTPARRASTLAAASVAAAAALTLALPASAQTWKNNNWRQRDRGAILQDRERHSIWSFTLEARFGGYYPNIDQAFAPDPAYPCGGPYRCFFGDGPQFYFGLELDWLPIRIPYVGKLGAGFGWGIVTYGSKAHNPDSTNWSEGWKDDTKAALDESTGMTLMPMHTSVVLRIDEIARRIVVPIVPYGKAGFGFGTFNSGTSSGTSKDASGVSAEGLSVGPHFALGGMLGLNWIDQRSGAMARETSGIDQAYIFGEWMFSDLKYGAGKGTMNIGTSTWVVGLALDL
jgi:hypothetical protein